MSLNISRYGKWLLTGAVAAGGGIPLARNIMSSPKSVNEIVARTAEEFLNYNGGHLTLAQIEEAKRDVDYTTRFRGMACIVGGPRIREAIELIEKAQSEGRNPYDVVNELRNTPDLPSDTIRIK